MAEWNHPEKYLPPDFETVLVWYEFESADEPGKVYQQYGLGSYVRLGLDRWCGNDLNSAYGNPRVIAWAHLPPAPAEAKSYAPMGQEDVWA